MPTPAPSNLTSPLSTRSLRAALGPALALTLAILAARFVYLAWLCPYDLAEDEAFYWDWSRNLAWSYNTKGPGIAWAIALSTTILGDTMLGVRAVAVFSASAFMLSAAALSALLAQRARLDDRSVRVCALIGASLAALMPGFQITSILSTIDGPYIACWSVACLAAALAIVRRDQRAWLLLGAALGVGFLFKYTILLLPLGLALFALRRRFASSSREPLRAGSPSATPWIVAGCVVFLLSLLPVVIWNAQHDWSTLRHLLGHLGLRLDDAAITGATGTPAASASGGGEAWSPRFFAEFAGAQLATVGPVLALMIAGVMHARHATQTRTLGSLLTWCAAPILLFYLAIAMIQEAEGNWAIAGFVSLVPLAAVYITLNATSLANAIQASPRRWPFALWHATIIVGLVTGLGALKLDWVQAVLAKVSPAAARAVPLGRIIGAQRMAVAIDAHLDTLRARTGAEPFVMVEHYGRASQMAFYLKGQPRVVCASSFVGGRRVQQDFWPDHRPDWPALRGRPAVVVDSFNRADLWRSCFTRVEPLGELPGGTRGTRFAFLCEGFTGLKQPERVGY
jgi:4-amino-4-deoxy-L-arabinose transferase-like glycosyltransferase